MEKIAKFVGKKVNKISYLQTLDTSVQHVEIRSREFSRHKNPDGTIGGFVENTAKVTKIEYINPKVHVLIVAGVLELRLIW